MLRRWENGHKINWEDQQINHQKEIFKMCLRELALRQSESVSESILGCEKAKKRKNSEQKFIVQIGSVRETNRLEWINLFSFPRLTFKIVFISSLNIKLRNKCWWTELWYLPKEMQLDFPSPAKPPLQTHLYEPTVFWHTASLWQLYVDLLWHSSLSDYKTRKFTQDSLNQVESKEWPQLK